MLFAIALAFALHVLFAVIWVGGMFFAYLCLRPSVATMTPADRSALWGRVLGRFFGFVLVAVPVMLCSGLYMVHVQGGMAAADPHVHIMLALGILMMLLFMHVFFAPYKRLQRALAAGDSELAARQVGSIRKLVAINLALGLCVVLDATAGKYLLA